MQKGTKGAILIIIQGLYSGLRRDYTGRGYGVHRVIGHAEHVSAVSLGRGATWDRFNHRVYAAFMLVLIPILGTFLSRWQGSRGRLGNPTIWLECSGLTCSRRVGLGGAMVFYLGQYGSIRYKNWYFTDFFSLIKIRDSKN